MAIYEDHLALARQLHEDMMQAAIKGEWPITIDAGFYAVFHGMEAVNALECRDTYSFADAADILETLLEPTLGRQFVADYRYMFFFRRGALYGAHIPSGTQLTEFVDRANRGFATIQTYLRKVEHRAASAE